jgi:two-component system OmpR family sensor kinase
MSAYSLQRRLSFGLTLMTLAFWCIATLVSALIVRHELDESFDSALQETAQRILPLAIESLYQSAPTDAAKHISALRPHQEYLTYVVRDAQGKVLLYSHDADPADFPAQPVEGFHDTPNLRIYGETGVSRSFFIEIAEPLSHRREAAWEASLGLVLPLIVLIPTSLGAVWWTVRRALAPVRHLRAEIERRDDADLSPIEGLRLPSEVSPLVGAVNRLMQRLNLALTAERSFTANSAHELRTPIAGALAQTQRLIAEAPPGALRARAEQVEESLQRLAHLAEKLLQLARAEAGLFLPPEAQDLLPLIPHILDAVTRDEGIADRVQVHTEAGLRLRKRIDADAFALILRNLLENALKHSPPASPVEVLLSEGAIRVRNHGPILTAEALTGLKARFARGATVAAGTGLGLAIAETIATGIGGRLDLLSPATGWADGVEAVLVVPAA